MVGGKMTTDFKAIDLKSMSEDKWWNIWHAIWRVMIDASQACGYCYIYGYKKGETWEKAHDPDCKKCEMFKAKVCVGPIPANEYLPTYEDFLLIKFMDNLENLKELAYKIREEITKDKNKVVKKNVVHKKAKAKS
jgi:glutaredoxin-related protein